MHALIAKLAEILEPRRVRALERQAAEAEALVGTPVHVREESHLFGYPRITRETQGFIQSADPTNGELLVGFTTEIPGEKLYLHAFADELVIEEAAHV